ncbi:sulfatase-like hydrolase/transferase [Paenibacillus sp. GCM10023248]|uniref:sulfatase-like hydrolase/transferase n=1 Tax=unclassified Paenibacillus TaxID=185978 RepID=UPI002379884F|nr:sulfatase-like hydrolase/transferase [Paenibacillus sp. MAHUQ-63]MDD9268558.1 sulfatase-like hydrolase/transferase [Paenibacillus sp. MAHUQ-63]
MKRPNVIIFYCDDLGYGDLGCYGSDAMKTPHLDRLAGEGIRFTNWYSNSPVCSPSRASLLTGKYPARAGISHILGGKRGTKGLPLEQKTLAAALKTQGYRTAIFGKWHLGASAAYGPNAHGFDQFYGFRAGCIDYYSHIFYWEQSSGVNPVHDLWQNETEVWENGQYMTEVITRETVAFIDDASDQEPYFLYVAYNAPHYPMHAPKAYIDRFPDLPPDRRIMAAMIAAVDDGVGEIVEALKRRGVFDDTIIFFSSDNGPSTEARNWLDGTEDLYYGGSAGRFRGHKASLFEGGIREPAILSYPAGLAACKGQSNDEVCAMMDIFPTMLELTGTNPGDYDLDGSSLCATLRGAAPGPHRQLFWEYGDQLAVREGKWKLVLNGKLDFSRTAADPVHLSDLEQDSGERVNLAEQFPDIARRLEEDVRRWYRSLNEEAQML